MGPETQGSLGQRIYAIREAMPREGRLAAISREAFAALLSARLGTPVSASAVADWEKDRTEPNRLTLAAIADLDPLRRGRLWLAWGETDAADPPLLVRRYGQVSDDVPATTPQRRAAEAAEAEAAKKKTAGHSTKRRG